MYIVIEKIHENEESANYRFWRAELGTDIGEIKIIKFTGETIIIADLDNGQKGLYSARAARKLFLHWKNNEYPGETCWAT